MKFDELTESNLSKSIHELQQMALNNDVDIEQLLRKAYLLSIAVREKDIEEWIDNELNGYKNVDSIPEYRYVRGELKAYNSREWISMQFRKKEDAESFSIAPFTKSVSEIVEEYKKSSTGFASYSITDEWTQILNKCGSFSTVYNFFVPTGQLKQIFSSVQNKILHWTIELEKDGFAMQENIVDICDRVISITNHDIAETNVMRELLSACVKLQANSHYYQATEDQRNDYIRDILDTAGYDVKDQTRRGLSSGGKAAGEIDILIKENDFPVTIIEALNLDSLDTAYLDDHIKKIYNYDTAGNRFNIILSYVTVRNFVDFCCKYGEHIKSYMYPFEMISFEESIEIGNVSYPDIKIMKTVHNRNGEETILYHICVLIKYRRSHTR